MSENDAAFETLHGMLDTTDREAPFVWLERQPYFAEDRHKAPEEYLATFDAAFKKLGLLHRLRAFMSSIKR